MVTREAAGRYGETLSYSSRLSWPVYGDLLKFIDRMRRDIRDLRPRDMIDMQSFLWIQGSDEYPEVTLNDASEATARASNVRSALACGPPCA